MIMITRAIHPGTGLSRGSGGDSLTSNLFNDRLDAFADSFPARAISSNPLAGKGQGGIFSNTPLPISFTDLAHFKSSIRSSVCSHSQITMEGDQAVAEITQILAERAQGQTRKRKDSANV